MTGDELECIEATASDGLTHDLAVECLVRRELILHGALIESRDTFDRLGLDHARDRVMAALALSASQELPDD